MNIIQKFEEFLKACQTSTHTDSSKSKLSFMIGSKDYNVTSSQ